MTFDSSKVVEFKSMFDQVHQQIRNFEGCSHLELLQSKDDYRIFFTYSYWSSPEALDRYRHSDLFKRTWAKTKLWFDAKPEAWSLDQLYSI